MRHSQSALPQTVLRRCPEWTPQAGAFLGVIAWMLLAASGAVGQSGPNYVAGTLFTLTDTPTAPNGVWSWFEDERAIIDASDPNNPRLLVSSVSAGSGAESGDIDLLWRNLTTGGQGHFELADRLEQDDHDSAALSVLPDGRYLAMYSRHGTDSVTRWRISTDPHDPTRWGAEQTLTNPAGTTYNNTYFLPGDDGGAGRMYNFTRTVNYDPNVQVSADGGQTWRNAGKLLTEGGGSDRPYLRYAASDEAIYFIATDRHPRNFANSVYSGYVRDGQLYTMSGTVVDNNLFNNAAVAPSALTPVFTNGTSFGGTTMNRAWTISLETDNTKNPVAVFSARANDDPQDHRFFYSRFDGAEWKVNELARAGGFLYAAEADYTGLVAIDPDNPNVVYMSSPINPATQAATPKYELYKGVTADFGDTWAWTAITAGSAMDNLRPVVPRWNGDQTAVVWLRGNYTSYTNWSTEVVGLSFLATDPKSLLWRGGPQSPSVWNAESAGSWDSGGGAVAAFSAGDEVAFDDTAATTTVAIQGTVSPKGVAFANRARDYLISGGGITGAGSLRVIGGGRVTLANGANPYAGETLVARGTLALAAGSSLSGTSRITVKEGATFDLSGLSGGGQLHAAQTLDLAGAVRGSLSAAAGSEIKLSSTAVVGGSLAAAGGQLVAAGRIEGDLAAADSTIRIGTAGMEGVRQAVYVNATHGPTGNTRLASGGIFLPTTNPDWQVRSPFGNGGVVYQGGSDSPGTAAMLETSVGGLVPGSSYHVYVNFWDASGSQWRIRAGTTSNQLTLFDSPLISVSGAVDGLDPATLNYAQQPLLVESNRTLWAGDLGKVVADAAGTISVYVDDAGTVDGDDRTWYDGITYLSDPIGFTGQATLSVGGNLSLTGASRLSLDIGTPAAHDRILVGGRMTFGGVLELSAVDESLLQQGDRFDLFEFATAAGSFSELLLPRLAPGLEWDSTDLNGSGTVAVVPAGYRPTLTLHVAGGTETQWQIGHPTISRAAAATKTGPGTLIFDAANSYTGPTTVAEGTLRLTHADAVASSNVTIEAGGTLAVADGVGIRTPAMTVAGGILMASSLAVERATGIGTLMIGAGAVTGLPAVTIGGEGVVSLAANERAMVAFSSLNVDEGTGGGRLDLGAGRITISAGGITAAELRADLLAGRNSGGWDGGTGITSAAAAAAGGVRGVGYVLAADGAAIVSYAAPGDVDLSGTVNVFDLVSINSSGTYGTAAASVWSTGDFNYDNVTNVFDLVSINTAAAYGQGNYFPVAPSAAGLGGVVAVPEPAAWLMLGGCGLAGLLARRSRRSS